MTKKIQADRIDEENYISSGPDQINQAENDIGDAIGIPRDTLLNNSPFTIDEYGNITASRDGDAIQTRFKGASGAAGLRIWNETQDEEVLIGMEDGYFIIWENTGTVGEGESATWKERFKLEITADSGDTPSQDILNHAGMPSSIASGEFLRGNSAGDGLEFASFDAATPPSAGVRHVGTADITTGGTYQDYEPDPMVAMTVDWDNDEIYVNYVPVTGPAIPYMEITSAGIYLIQITANWQAGAGTDGGYRSIGYGALTGNSILRFNRVAPIDATGTIAQQQTATFVESFSADAKLYVKFAQTSGADLGVTLNRFAVTKISQV